MCQTQADGGKRCYAHTRPRYEALVQAMDAKATGPFGADSARKKGRDSFKVSTDLGDENALNVVANHASTANGAKQVAQDIERYSGANDPKTAAFLKSGLKRGTERAEAFKEANAIIRKERAKREGHRGGGAGTGSVEVLKPSRGTTAENNCVAVHPSIGTYWKAEDNDGIGPEQCRPGSNGQLNWRCGECQRLVSKHNFRVNSLTSTLRDGRIPVCDACDPRRKARFERTQQELAALTDVLGDDPDAFNALPAALQYNLMSHMGLLRGNDDSMNRNIAMSIVHGDLTLKDVVLANDLKDVDAQIRDHGDDDADLSDVSNVDVPDDAATPTSAKVDQILACTGVLDLVDETSDLATNVRRSTNEGLWERAYDAEERGESLDEYVAFLDSRRGYNAQADAALDRFKTELEAVRATDLPEGYQASRTTAEGTTITIDPSLAQRRFAALVEDKRRFMNWSGTGAGKTLSATLALQSSGARESIVVCPKAVIGQWEAEFRGGFPDNTEVRIGLPVAGEQLDPPPPGVNRVWVTNYDQFQGDPDELKKRINPLANRLDAIVYDELHMAKATDEASISNRRKALQDFTDRAGRANPDLIVVGASATPVVNNLEEAKSLLRLVEGPGSKAFPTKPTMKNAATAFTRISAAGVRHLPRYETTLTRSESTVDITANIDRVQARINTMVKESRGDRATPAMMERALLPEKLPTIVAKVQAHKASNSGPTVVYTEYTSGVVGPMRTALEREGLRVGTYTGNESDAERKASLQAFNRGELDVLIGSKPIATGVDGLQHTSSNMIVASAAWTAALDDQLVGRLQRRGQQRNVNVDYVLTEAKAGTLRWSWCKDNRIKRIHFKRDIANAAVDGILPDGTFESNEQGADRAMKALKDLTSSMARNSVSAA